LEKIYLIGNNKFLKPIHFKDIRDHDIGCFMNGAKSDGPRFSKNKKFLFLNFCNNHVPTYKITHYHRFFTTFFILPLRYTLINENNPRNDQYSKYKDNKSFLAIPNVVNLKEYSKSQPHPTTGFVAYQKMKSMFPKKEIILVGFDGLREPNNHFWGLHDYNNEQQYYKLNKIKLISAL